MKLIGAFEGEYQGNKYARIICIEKFNSAGGRGSNATISKINYNYWCDTIRPDWELYQDQEVFLNYDRFGKVQEIRLKS